MAFEISEQFRFEHLLAHTFPGFLSAIALFMFLDVFSPRDLTSWVFNNIQGVIGFIGFVVLIGTILGIIIDGVHHLIIENIFKKFTGYREIHEFSEALYPRTEPKLIRPYFFEKEKFMQVDEYITTKVYRYSECHVNIFISLITFLFISPFYLFNVLQIPWIYSIFFASIAFFVACASLISGYVDFKKYHRWMNSAICGYLKCEYYIRLSKQILGDRNIELEAAMFDKESQIRLLKGGIKVNFKQTLGEIALKNNGKTDVYGIARATLTSNKSGATIVTATSKKCIPGIITVRF